MEKLRKGNTKCAGPQWGASWEEGSPEGAGRWVGGKSQDDRVAGCRLWGSLNPMKMGTVMVGVQVSPRICLVTCECFLIISASE